ncbi:MAG: protein phosphatase 2C domain-containing protein [Muribaculaceae bacterium]|nr:protein phosphatase 2C domain-containing protein [Muribaculaceae bacterium]
MKFQLEALQILEFGKRKDNEGSPHQEDALFPPFGRADSKSRLFIVCDGMGGHESGEVASAAVCDSMSREIFSSQKSPEAFFSVSDFERALSKAYDALDAYKNTPQSNMGTTLTFLKLHSGGALVAHIGDSRVYHIRPGKDAESTRILHVTPDHSLVNDLLRSGELTPEQAVNFPRKNVITRAMQPGMSPRPKADIYTTTDILPGDYFYLCSDGMLEQTEESHIKFIFSETTGGIQAKQEILRRTTADNSDNHTAIIVHITAVEDMAEGMAEGMNSSEAIEPEELEPIPRQIHAPQSNPAPQPSPSPSITCAPTVETPVVKRGGKQGGISWIKYAVVVVVAAAIAVIAYLLFGGKKEEEVVEPQAEERVEYGQDHIQDAFGDRSKDEVPRKESVRRAPAQQQDAPEVMATPSTPEQPTGTTTTESEAKPPKDPPAPLREAPTVKKDKPEQISAPD